MSERHSPHPSAFRCEPYVTTHSIRSVGDSRAAPNRSCSRQNPRTAWRLNSRCVEASTPGSHSKALPARSATVARLPFSAGAPHASPRRAPRVCVAQHRQSGSQDLQGGGAPAKLAGYLFRGAQKQSLSLARAFHHASSPTRARRIPVLLGFAPHYAMILHRRGDLSRSPDVPTALLLCVTFRHGTGVRLRRRL